MSGQLGNCQCACPNPEVVEIPGAPGENGAAGTNGTNGVNAFTFLTAQLEIPTVGNTVIASVAVSSWMALGQVVIVSDGTEKGHFEVTALPGSTSATLEFLEYPGDSVATTIIANAAKVSPAGIVPPLAASLPTAFTDNTGGTASDTLAATVGVETICIPVTLPTGGTSAADRLTTYTPGYAFEIIQFSYVAAVGTTGASGSRDWSLEIGSTDVGAPTTLTISTANSGTPGTVLNSAAIAAANTGTASDTISIEVAAGGTTYDAGSGAFLIKVRNMDTVNAVASLAEHIDDLITSLT